MPFLHTLQLSQHAPRRGGMPQVMKIAFSALVAWLLLWIVVWLVGLAV